MVELLVVIVIISLLASAGTISYQSFNKQGRDARRKADLEQIRGALELYRSNNNSYPTPTGTFGMTFGSGILSDASNTYLSKLPQDPKSSNSYYYGVANNEYVIYAKLEGVTTCSSTAGITPDCEQATGTQSTCNYCLGPYGEK